MPVKIFFCYAHEDEELLNKLKKQLRPLQRQRLLDVWYDRDISAGTEWEQEIKKHLNEANIILLLVSPDFMDSEYCYSIEMQKALERHEKSEAIAIPIILRPTHWQGVLGKLQALPKDGSPVKSRSWRNMDEAFFNITEGIRTVAAGIRFDWIQEPTTMLDIAPGSKEASTELPVSSSDIPAEITKNSWFLAPSYLVDGSNPQDYEAGIDHSVTSNRKSSGYLKAKVAQPSGFSTLMQMFKADSYRNQRMRFSAAVKSEGLDGWAGLWMRVDGPVQTLDIDNMHNRPIKGTTDWQKYEVVLDVPQESVNVAFGILLEGKGQVWLSDVQFEQVQADVPVTSFRFEYQDQPQVDFL
jgi:hypothetical protein